MTLALDRNVGGGALGDVHERALLVHGHDVEPGDLVEVPEDGPRHGQEHMREAAELVVRVEGGHEEGLWFVGACGREEPFAVVARPWAVTEIRGGLI